jgi:amino acid adenylation domain-containing protein
MSVETDSPAHDFAARTPSEMLRRRAARQGGRPAYTFLRDGETAEASLTYAELDRRARAVGDELRSRGSVGSRALLLYPPGLEYVAALFGCFYAGVIAVPVYPPRLNRHLLRLRAILADAQACVALTDAGSLPRLASLFDQLPELKSVQLLATDTLPDGTESEWRGPEPGGESLALLQYTSGSTGTPRGVMLSHQNLAHNSALLARAFEYGADSLCVSWLPIYHDMGLIGGVLQPLYGGFPCVLMSPASFLQRPSRWLEAISHYRATLSGGPNFAYDLCARRVTAEQRASLDLSSWDVAFNGAEPIREETLARFAETFGPCGFRRQAFFPCYGLAEATLLVSGGPKDARPVVKTVDAESLEGGHVAEARADGARARPLVGSGQIRPDERVVVVNPETSNACASGKVGEIWVSSRSVALGYWSLPDESERTFRARLSGTGEGPFLRTGDLGFIADGELFITGRLKDLVIIRGRNHYPQDIELSAERSHAALRPACGAAFNIEAEGEERLVIVHEVEPRRRPDLKEVIDCVRRAVAENHELQVHAVTLLRAGTIPKTSSGKIQRRACRAEFLANSFDALAEWRETTTPELETPASVPPPASTDVEDVEAYLASQLAARVGLDAAEIDRNQSIAHYGLDSVGAVELAHRIQSGVGIVLPVPSLLEGHSIKELAALMRARLNEPRGEPDAPSASPHEEDFSYPLSHGQRALWFLQQTSPESAAYNIASAFRIRGELDRRALRRAFERMAERHPSLRTVFSAPDGEPVQTARRHAALAFVEEDVSHRDPELLTARLNEEAHLPFNLEQGPPMRIRLFTKSDGGHVLLWVAHHIALDFWSLGILMRELSALYASAKDGGEASFETPGLQYADYVRWQREVLAGPEGERLWTYWRKELAGPLPSLNLPADRPRPPIQTYRGAQLPFRLSVELTRRLRSLARKEGATLYMLLLAAYQVLLYRYTNQETIVVGSSAAGRGRAEVAGLVGYFVNSLALRGNPSGGQTFASFLARVRRTTLEAFAHQDYPFPLLVERLQPERDPSRTPLFQTMFVLHKARRPEEDFLSLLALRESASQIKLDELELESIPLEQRAAQFELTLAVAETERRLTGAFQYNTDLFDEETISRMAAHFRMLLEGIVDGPERRLSELPLLADEEQRRIVFDWNDTGPATPAGECLHELFERQAGRTPEAVALVCGDRRLTYRELNARANRLARHLRDSGVGAESLVGVLMRRSLEMPVSLLGVLKAGAAYVPLDPEQPPERLSWMMADAGVGVLLTEGRLADGVAVGGNSSVVRVDAEWGRIAERSGEPVAGGADADNLAYVIYTSGSTGRPKGVMISHRGLVNYLRWCVNAYDVAGGDGAPVHSSIGFDLTVTSLFAPLLAGRSVWLSEGEGGEALLSATGGRRGYSFLKLTPSHLDLLNQALEGESVAGLTSVLILGGEPLHGESLKRWRQHSPATRIFNEYGPTEAVVGCCVYEVPPGADLSGDIPVGRPIANAQLYVLDENLNPLPPGLTGELYIGGVGLARGYLNRPVATAREFIPHPFSREPGARLYRTGDRARYSPDGVIEFLGRFDGQVKLRGYRVELGEIEAVLREHPAIREAVVTAGENARGSRRLAAYFVPADADVPAPAELRRHLQEKLPEYMVPSAFVALGEIPLTANGKADRKALGRAEFDGPETAEGFVAPRTETEKRLAEIWSQVLDVRRVGVCDNFFALGGHSLLAMQIISRTRDAFGVELPLPILLKSPTVEKLAQAVDEVRGGGGATQTPRLVPVSRADYRAKLSAEDQSPRPRGRK